MKDWKGLGLEGCRVESVELKGCRIGMCDFMDYTGSIILWIFYFTLLGLQILFPCVVLCCVVLLCKLPALTDRPPTKIVFFIWEVELKFRCSSFSHRISFIWTLRTAQPSRQIISFCLPTVFADLWWHIEKINIESVRVYLIIYYFICFPKQFCGVTREYQYNRAARRYLNRHLSIDMMQ